MIWLVIVLGVASLAILSDALGEPSSSNPGVVDSGNATNAMCPVTTDEKVVPDISTMFNGREVYFCCRMCKRQFERDPQAYVENLPTGYFVSATSGAAGSGESGESTGSQDHGDDGDYAHGNAAESNSVETAGGHDHASHESSSGADEASHAEGGGGHDHSAHGKDESKGLFMRFIGWLGNFHPPSVNFPVALMTAALVAEGLFMATGRPLFDHAGRFTAWFAILGTVGAVILGWFFGGFKLVDDDWIMTTHRWVGTAAGLSALVLAGFAAKAWSGSDSDEGLSPHRKGYRVALLVAVLLVNANGFFGGALMYGIDHYAW